MERDYYLRRIYSATERHAAYEAYEAALHTYFLLFLDAEDGGTWGGMAAASLRGLPRGRLSAWARLSVDVAPTPLEDGEGPWSEGSTVLSSDDILKTKQKKNCSGWSIPFFFFFF